MGPLGSILAELEVPREVLTAWLSGEEASPEWESLRPFLAEELAFEALAISDATPVEVGSVERTRLAVKLRLRAAALLDPDRWG